MRLLNTSTNCKIISLANRKKVRPLYIEVNNTIYPSSYSNIEEDQLWLLQLKQTIVQNLNNSQLNSAQLAKLMFMSRAQLYRKTKSLSKQAPGQLLKQARLAKAIQLLESPQRIAVKAVAFEVGYKDVKYFAQQFKKEFGKYPSEC